MAEKEKGRELNLEATVDNLDTVIEFVNGEIEDIGCDMKTQLEIEMAVEELFSNIANYAYQPRVGVATVRVEVLRDPLSVVITFIDQGKPYDPLAKEDPDLDQTASQTVGGLGIFMVKKSMDHIAYEYIDGQNVLTIRKNI